MLDSVVEFSKDFKFFRFAEAFFFSVIIFSTGILGDGSIYVC